VIHNISEGFAGILRRSTREGKVVDINSDHWKTGANNWRRALVTNEATLHVGSSGFHLVLNEVVNSPKRPGPSHADATKDWEDSN